MRALTSLTRRMSTAVAPPSHFSVRHWPASTAILYVLATKVFFPMSDQDRGLSAAQIQKQINASLQRLRTDYVDLYQCHCYDPSVPLLGEHDCPRASCRTRQGALCRLQ